MNSQLQGQDEIIVEAPIEHLWPLIADSTLLPDWGLPVRKAEILSPLDQSEGLGSRRRIEAELNGKKGSFVERRTEHLQGRKDRLPDRGGELWPFSAPDPGGFLDRA